MSIKITQELIDQVTKHVQTNLDDKNHFVEKDYMVIANVFHPLEMFAEPATSKTMFKPNADFAIAHEKQMLNLMSGQQSMGFGSLLPWGKDWFEKLKEKVKTEFCTNETIHKFFTTGTTLNDFVTKVLPIIVAAIGLSVLNPIIMAALVSIITALIKAGYDAVCHK